MKKFYSQLPHKTTVLNMLKELKNNMYRELKEDDLYINKIRISIDRNYFLKNNQTEMQKLKNKSKLTILLEGFNS